MILRALNHELRQQIIQLLCDEGSLNVTDIFVNLRVEQSVVSQHLAILRKAEIVIRERKGKFIHYDIDRERLHRINDLVAKLAA
ncbi:ArsR family transcriptional regulator [Neolewinella xylanilytica]|uniref:ArsR family transcriptional regulator n=2 Tax=Neolewinella xylanilytica TaxID=1514080 RepID=A0A2S6I7R9_9BACT|nr:ArsR family transcriptional regulator [Neolewinella xylanilytica]